MPLRLLPNGSPGAKGSEDLPSGDQHFKHRRCFIFLFVGYPPPPPCSGGQKIPCGLYFITRTRWNIFRLVKSLLFLIHVSKA